MSRQFPLTIDAIQGFDSTSDKECSAMYSSPAWYAWQAGRYLRFCGEGKPTAAKMSRGYSVYIETASKKMTVRFDQYDDPSIV